jgi:plastocyanin
MSLRDFEATWGLRIGIAGVLVVFTSGCGSADSGSSPTPLATLAATVTIQANARTLSTFAFVPNPVTVSSGGAVTWSNTDTTTHDMISDTGIWDSGRIAPGARFDFAFPSKGTFPYHCAIHSGMVGTVVVE